MGGGVRVELRIDSPEECPVADLSGATGGTGRSISWSTDPETGRTIEEFVLEAGDEAGSDEEAVSAPIEAVFSDGARDVYRFDRPRERDCPCVSIERFGCPIASVETRDGALFVSFHVSEIDDVREILSELRSAHDTMSVERIIRSETTAEESTLVHVDREALTDRQAEVLATALEMGYFEHPKQANAGDVAAELDINRATFAEHLAAAQRKLLPAIVGE